MLNLNGEIYFEEFDETIIPRMNYESFKKTTLFKKSKNRTINQLYPIFTLPDIVTGNKKIGFQIFFHEDFEATYITVFDRNACPKSWEDYSTEKEKSGNESTREWIETICKVYVGKHKWGKISLDYDFKNGTHDWGISYSKK